VPSSEIRGSGLIVRRVRVRNGIYWEWNGRDTVHQDRRCQDTVEEKALHTPRRPVVNEASYSGEGHSGGEELRVLLLLICVAFG